MDDDLGPEGLSIKDRGSTLMSSNKCGTLDPEEQQRAHRKRHEEARRLFGDPIRFQFSVSQKKKARGKERRKEERYCVERIL